MSNPIDSATQVDAALPTDTIAAASPSLMPLGQIREKNAISVQEMSQKTRLSVKQIEALESGQMEQLPGLAFVKGAIRSYAKTLGVNSQPYIDALMPIAGLPDLRQGEGNATLAPAVPGAGEYTPSGAGSTLKWAIAVGALLVIAALYYGNSASNQNKGQAEPVKSSLNTEPTSSAGVGQSPPSAAPAVPAVAPPVNTATSNPPAAAPEPASGFGIAPGTSATAPSASGVSSTASSSGSGVALSVPPSAPIPIVIAGNQGTIELVFAKDSWVTIRDASGKAVADRLFKAGTTTNLQATAPLKLSIGAAAGVVLTWNGQVRDLKPDTKDDVARFSITQ
jgi:cytoskeleton protein RodZ